MGSGARRARGDPRAVPAPPGRRPPAVAPAEPPIIPARGPGALPGHCWGTGVVLCPRTRWCWFLGRWKSHSWCWPVQGEVVGQDSAPFVGTRAGGSQLGLGCSGASPAEPPRVNRREKKTPTLSGSSGGRCLVLVQDSRCSFPSLPVLVECCARLCPALGSGTGSTLSAADPCARLGTATGERCQTGTAAAGATPPAALGATVCQPRCGPGSRGGCCGCRPWLGGAQCLSLCPQIARSEELAQGRCPHQRPWGTCGLRLNCCPSLGPPPGQPGSPARRRVPEAPGRAGKGQGRQCSMVQPPSPWGPRSLQAPLNRQQAGSSQTLSAWGGPVQGPRPLWRQTQILQPHTPQALTL